MTRAPYVLLKPEAAYDRGARTMEDTTLGWRFVNPRMQEAYPPISLGETAECVADQWTVSRERQDAFALESQRRAAAAIEAGRFDGQLVPVSVPGRKGAVTVVDRDEHPRETSLEALGALKPAFRCEGGTVTAGNSSGINDGAAALLLVEADRARALGSATRWRASCRRRSRASTRMSWGSARCRRSARRSSAPGSTAADLDVVEINEAFASQSVACMDELGLDPVAREPERRGDRARPPARRIGRAARRRCSSTSSSGPAAATASRRCASAWARGSPRSWSASRRSAPARRPDARSPAPRRSPRPAAGARPASRVTVRDRSLGGHARRLDGIGPASRPGSARWSPAKRQASARRTLLGFRRVLDEIRCAA